jgi:hypothetical protein
MFRRDGIFGHWFDRWIACTSFKIQKGNTNKYCMIPHQNPEVAAVNSSTFPAMLPLTAQIDALSA